MTIRRMLNTLLENLEIAKKSSYVKKPYSWALYQTWKLIDQLEKEIDNAPTVPLPDFKEGYKQAIIDGKTNFSRPQGEWIKIDEEWYDYKCSICGEKVRNLYQFCPNCGADMKGGAE